MINPGHLNNLLKTFEKSASRLSEGELMTKEKMVEFVAKNVTKKIEITSPPHAGSDAWRRGAGWNVY